MNLCDSFFDTVSIESNIKEKAKYVKSFEIIKIIGTDGKITEIIL